MSSKKMTNRCIYPSWLRLILAAGLFLTSTPLHAAEVLLDNGDRLTGAIVSDAADHLILETRAMGAVTINKAFIKEFKTDEQLLAEAREEQKMPELEWTRKAALSYSQKGGNEVQSNGAGDIYINRKTPGDEATLKVSGYIDTEDSKTDSRSYHGLVRYANSFGMGKKWFQFGKVEGSKDTTANIDYRVTPSYGVGYWFKDEKDFKLRVDGALGWEYTKYVDATRSDSEAIFSPSGHLEKRFRDNLSFIQDLTLYPSLEEAGEYRLRSESTLTGRIVEQLAWRFSFIDDLDSDPSAGTKKNDYQFLSGVEYSF